jgi:hypothetical protein
MLRGVRDGEITHPMAHCSGRLLEHQENPGSVAQRLMTLLGECGFDGYMDDTPAGNVATAVIYPSQMIRLLHERLPARIGEVLGLDENCLGRVLGWPSIVPCDC